MQNAEKNVPRNVYYAQEAHGAHTNIYFSFHISYLQEDQSAVELATSHEELIGDREGPRL